MRLTHADLVAAAVRWLRGRHRCAVVFSEWAPSSISEIPDAIGFHRQGGSILVECKVSRSDFAADRHKMRARINRGMGAVRWYLTPPGLVRADEVPAGWGLAEVHPRCVRIVVAAPRPTHERDLGAEVALLAAAVWRHEHGVEWHAASARFAPVAQGGAE